MFNRLVKIVRPSDRRKQRRARMHLPATMGNLRGRVTDLSLGGCGFYASDQGLNVGDHVMAVLLPPGQEPIEIPATVVGTDAEQMVFCIAFTAVGEEAFDRIESLILHQAAG